MKKILIITAIVLILVWLYRRNKAKATDNPVEGIGNTDLPKTELPPTPTKPFVGANNSIPSEYQVTKPPYSAGVEPLKNNPQVNTSTVISVKPGTAEISPFIQSISIKK